MRGNKGKIQENISKVQCENRKNKIYTFTSEEQMRRKMLEE